MKASIERYKVVIWWSEIDDCFLAKMPELNGVMGDGATQEEALAAVRDVGEAWISVCQEIGRPIPEPEAIAA